MNEVLVKTIQNPARYGRAQLELAVQVARVLARGKLVLVETPKP